MHFNGKCWFDLFKEQFISLLNFCQNDFVQLRWNWFSVGLLLTNAWNCHSLYTAFSSNVEAWVMWACSLFLLFYHNYRKRVRLNSQIVQNISRGPRSLGHLSIKDSTRTKSDFLSEGFIFAYQQAHHGIK